MYKSIVRGGFGLVFLIGFLLSSSVVYAGDEVEGAVTTSNVKVIPNSPGIEMGGIYEKEECLLPDTESTCDEQAANDIEGSG